MGRAVASSKSKKNSEEDRRKRKNPKSRKNRRASFSSSSYSSDADDVSRGRRRSRRKPEKRRGRDPKRSLKRKSRKARRRSVSAASRDSSSSCSTCRSRSSGSLNRSRSPARGRDDRRDKLKKKVKRGRKLDRVVRSLRSRNRSLSCSTCSGSREPSQTPGHREAKNKERDGSRQMGSSSVVESRGEEEERYGIGGREIGNVMVMANYDDSQLPRTNVGRNVDSVEEDRVMDEGSYEQGAEIDRWMSEGNVENESYFDQFEDNATQASEHYKEPEPNTKLSSWIRSEIVATDNHDSDSDDLELMLRQKALENLKKLRRGPSSDNRSTEDRKNEIAGVESSEKQCETAKKIISSPKSRSIVFNERRVQLGVPSHDSKVNPVIQLPSLEANTSDKKMLFSRLDQSRNSKQLESSTSGQSTSNLLNNMEDSPEKMSHKQSPCRVSQEKNTTEGCGSGNSLKSEVNLGDGKEKIRENNETVDECQSGSQFEQKTFSRMHDGEMVQVSYKVYIPKKAPALARRKLQR
ncbi:pre-mRNA-splicing factor CWC22 homolog [Dendrobium catenatum]|uniref:pre-mRNA-splicing factor CWC22 homolog n=1 Tax=Dendrobium catenatum TaxID=906689 RepID=UPI0009F68C20|nr:pre-mRNA-splicing factor CWC22 homolog [Dendrobium catenatum]XP_028554627.1 pre-mRNA-splicing factor CWC22 homolog [Dendrobium catenatum]